MNRSPEQLELAALHVSYELVQLVKMSCYLEVQPLPGELHNACLESLLLHARSLIDFLLLGKGSSGDLHRSDFIPMWAPVKGEETKRLRAAMPMLHRHLAHLTWERVDASEQEWSYRHIAADVLHVYADFVAQGRATDAPGLAQLESALMQAKLVSRAPAAAPHTLLATTTGTSG